MLRFVKSMAVVAMAGLLASQAQAADAKKGAAVFQRCAICLARCTIKRQDLHKFCEYIPILRKLRANSISWQVSLLTARFQYA